MTDIASKSAASAAISTLSTVYTSRDGIWPLFGWEVVKRFRTSKEKMMAVGLSIVSLLFQGVQLAAPQAGRTPFLVSCSRSWPPQTMHNSSWQAQPVVVVCKFVGSCNEKWTKTEMISQQTANQPV